MTNAVQKRSAADRQELDHVVGGIFNSTLRRFFTGNLWDVDGAGSVPVNIRENDQQYELDVIAPGCQRSDFKITVQNNHLLISFACNDEKQKEAEAGWVRNEYVLRPFERRFSLDDTVDREKISAAYNDGILRVTLPKTDNAKPRSLSIEVK
ncbi:MAG: hypothetical protein DI535_04790 [Citrobacter freundii]|nr:MAG: hypothetical protein DI535_04790 [Citrobacter freundii]